VVDEDRVQVIDQNHSLVEYLDSKTESGNTVKVRLLPESINQAVKLISVPAEVLWQMRKVCLS
jgi:hypothetical protein